MAVIADTSPLNYLLLIGAEDVLAALYQRVLIPESVLQELQHPDSPKIVAQWTARLPAWIEVVPSHTFVVEPELMDLDPGERSAIALAMPHRPGALRVMDDWKGRRQAERRGIPTVGTLGVLRDAAAQRLVDLPAAFAHLRQTSFRAPADVMAALLIADAKRGSRQH
jgi:predicted nucleic acid-binding protein